MRSKNFGTENWNHRTCLVAMLTVALIGVSSPGNANDGEVQLAANADDVGIEGSGPKILVRSPLPAQTYDADFPIDVEFSPSDRGHAVNMKSLRVTYRRFWPIDITDRVRKHINANAIHVPDARLSAGRHQVELYIEDEAKNSTRRRFEVVVAN